MHPVTRFVGKRSLIYSPVTAQKAVLSSLLRRRFRVVTRSSPRVTRLRTSAWDAKFWEAVSSYEVDEFPVSYKNPGWGQKFQEGDWMRFFGNQIKYWCSSTHLLIRMILNFPSLSVPTPTLHFISQAFWIISYMFQTNVTDNGWD